MKLTKDQIISNADSVLTALETVAALVGVAKPTWTILAAIRNTIQTLSDGIKDSVDPAMVNKRLQALSEAALELDRKIDLDLANKFDANGTD